MIQAEFAKPRLLALDMTRTVAILGMLTVHIAYGLFDQPGLGSWLSHTAGYSSGGFAVLSGVAISLTNLEPSLPLTWRTLTWQVLRWRVVLLRSLFLFVAGLLLTQVTSGPLVILCVYASLFVLAAGFQGCSGKGLLMIGLGGMLVLPVVSFWLRNTIGPSGNLFGPTVSWPMLFAPNAARVVLQTLFLDGMYPLMTWLPLALVGWGADRSGLLRVPRARVLLVGVLGVLALGFGGEQLIESVWHPRAEAMAALEIRMTEQAMANSEDKIMIGEFVRNEGITRAQAKTRILETYMPTTQSLARAVDHGWGVPHGNGISGLLLGGHHTGTTLEMLQIAGVTGLVFLLMQAISGVGVLARVWSWPGRISLSVYALHIVVKSISDNTGLIAFVPDQVVVFLFAYWFGAFVLGWWCRKRKGPLESLLALWLRLGASRKPV
jgi:hypothetical protein